jgi:L-arabinose 1-dehydrogenase
VRIGLIGLGVISPFFADAISQLPGMDITAACDRDAAKLDRYRQRGVATFADHEELLSSNLVDGVVVALPNQAHHRVAGAALRRGVHVCCEKPLTLTYEDAVDLAALSRQTGTTLFTAFHRRYNRNLAAVTAAVRDRSGLTYVAIRYLEKIQEHTGTETWYLDAARSGGGCLVDNGPNAIDLAIHLLGPLDVVSSHIGKATDGVEFLADVDLATQEGIPVRISLDWAWPKGELKDVVVCRNGGQYVQANLLTGFDAMKSSLAHEYLGIMADFHQAVASGTEHGERGVDVVRLVTDAYRFAGRTAQPASH